MKELPEKLSDGNIELRRIPATFANAEMIFDVIERNRAKLEKWLPWVDGMQNAGDEFVYLYGLEKNKKPHYWIFVDGKFCGSVGLVKVRERMPRFNEGEIGYWIDSNFYGRGIMTRAVKILENELFGNDEYEIHRIIIRNETENVKSAAVAQRLGYNLDGIMRQGGHSANKIPADINIFGKLKSEWKK
ncbi:MAG: GNAT family N-acetyltransferase [Rickettsiales bacterium]|jgi:ribosomal-protein-serine acetyltransferase|nr:GNAT family N-acetyltransferase [Rickettsiales bacterium]